MSLREPQNGAAKVPVMCIMMFQLHLALWWGKSYTVVYVTSELKHRHTFKIAATLCFSFK